jgi:hypothetical protein
MICNLNKLNLFFLVICSIHLGRLTEAQRFGFEYYFFAVAVTAGFIMIYLELGKTKQ